jgi:hypothetical protein
MGNLLQTWRTGTLGAITAIGLACALSPQAAHAGEPNLVLDADLTLGGAEVSDEYFFGSVSSVVEDSKGNIYVLDRNLPALMKFSREGALQQVLDNAGDGPGDLMSHPSAAIDSHDRIYIVGQGSRVEILDAKLTHVGSFERRNAVDLPRAIAVFADGSVVICVRGRQDETIIDLYGPDHMYRKSFSDNFVTGKNMPWYVGTTYIGGDLAIMAPDALVYAQMAPYAIRKFDKAGTLLVETRAGGADYVPEPPMPEVDGDRITYHMFPATSGIVALSNGHVLVTSFSRGENDAGRSLLCLYDSNVALVAVGSSAGFESVVGSGRDGAVYLYRKGEEHNVVVRARVGQVKGR